MQLIRDVIEWFANDGGSALATLFPYMLVGLLGLYVLWLVIGYLRVSQVGLAEERPAGHVIALPSDGAAARPRGVPYCPVDGLQYPLGARYCTSCERDLELECATCGATLSSAAASCYRCGTPVASGDRALLA